MNTLKRFFSNPAAHAVLFVFFFFLMSWPVLSIADQGKSAHTISIFFFALWTVMIAALFFVARHCRKDVPDTTDPTQEPETH